MRSTDLSSPYKYNWNTTNYDIGTIGNSIRGNNGACPIV
ncbi:MAG: hypothetical protein JSV88_07395 [Candidatus Aminicenantes bacterium]|nr:MAG: hypothetical protein JSV88_07395 [Candidatus Aminicenantes bacterium]